MSTKKNDRCVHLFDCSGCEPDALQIPPPVWESMQTYFLQKNCTPHFFSKELTSWRLRAKLAVRQEKGQLKIGLFKRKSHHVVEIPECLSHHPLINRALFQLKKEMKALHIFGYEEKKNQGDVRYLQLTVERSSEKVQLVLVVPATQLENKMKELAQNLFEKSSLWHSIWVNLQPFATNTIFGSSWHHLHGEEFLFETICKENIAFHPAAFFQAHLSLFEEMIESMKKNMQDTNSIAEFYAGVGLIGKCLKNKASRIFLIEENPFAKSSFFASLKQEEEKIFSYFSCDVDQKIDLCSQAETIIVDPPRPGISSSLIEALCQKESGQLIYLSCYFPSFKRDMERLVQKGWTLERAEGYLLFPKTNHVEILAFLKKDPGERI